VCCSGNGSPEAKKSQARPRVTADARAEQGITSLTIAAENDDVALASEVSTHVGIPLVSQKHFYVLQGAPG